MTTITIKGKKYTLRYDMSVAEWLEDKYGDTREAFSKMHGTKESKKVISDIFCCMATAANDFLGVPEIVSDVELFDKHTSPGRVAVIMRAIIAAFNDGNKMQSADEEDAEVRDDYLKELKEEEKKKN